MKLGIDLGGTTIKGALLSGQTFLREFSAPTRGKEGREAILASLFSVIDELAEGASPELIGISSAGNIDPYRGVCVYATENLMGWTGMDVRGAVWERYHIPCRVENDAICALKGELLFYPGLKDVTMLTFGTGVGGASLVDGAIVRGAHFDGARWGHVLLEEGGRRCSCGAFGCAESYLSATALLARAQETFPHLTDCRELFALYGQKDPQATEVLREYGGYLNSLLDLIRAQIAPQRIILGGGLASSDAIFESLIEKKSDIAFARFKNRAGIVGACL